MWANAGPLRTQERLETCLDDLARLRRDCFPRISAQTPFPVKAALEVESLMEVADIVTRAALLRTESRGCHFRADYPATDHENWLCHIVCVRDKGLYKEDVVTTRIPLPETTDEDQRVGA